MTEYELLEQEKQIAEALTGTNRTGIDKLLEWLSATDFFRAPASANHHSAFEGGLAYHSLKVLEAMEYNGIVIHDCRKPSSIPIVALLHDVCKIDCYRSELRNTKDERGNWIKVPFWKHNNVGVALDHGVRSLYLIQHHIKLTEEEALAIRWHMGFSSADGYEARQALSEAFKIPLVLALHQSDMEAAYLREATP